VFPVWSVRTIRFAPCVAGQRQERLFQSGARDLQTAQLRIARQQFPDDGFCFDCVKLDGFAIFFRLGYAGNLAQSVDGETRDAANPLAGSLRFDLSGTSLSNDFSLIDHGNTVRECVGFLQIMGCKQNGFATRHHFADFIPQHAARFHVEPDRWLIEEEQVRIAADGQREQHALLLAARKITELAIAEFLEANGGEVVFDDTYRDNPLVNVFCLGILPAERLVLARADGPGNLAVLLGSSTGRDGSSRARGMIIVPRVAIRFAKCGFWVARAISR